ncbi:DEAD/DEAH box helicase domain-containing protein [Gordonia neofelifaecis NRRL B-59395]|uniref:DEAD/DEAH box helicase domain-containing protein n=1 Tax=Gordonia neofelifaecis NRRL B-59395 TaxID=644548 RepID=F1YMS4_9ACTN|nr:DEAD/DEAH box helicase domain-containing protein [Gordonia neofelifaecis NRRL B-59395]
MYFALGRGQRAYYTAPIKALVSEKFFDLCNQFGAENVGLLTGDASVNADAPVVCATAEIVANIALRDGPESDVGVLIADEFHYYGESDRGWAWQVPLIELPHTQFLLMSATLGSMDFFIDDLTRRTGRPTVPVTGAERPVPLQHRYAMTPIHETIEELINAGQAPVYVVHFTQQQAVERAQALLSAKICTKEEKAAIAEAIGDFQFRTGFGNTLSKLLRAGIGVHHAGMLPRYRRLVERLAQAGLLKVVAGTDTLGVGINVPIRTVLFAGLTKYDGHRVRRLRAREFHQIAGRAGRAGYDTVGYVVAQAPEHDVDNARAVAKAGDDPKKLRKVVRRKAPEGFVSWGEKTFETLIDAPDEELKSHFRMTTAMLMEVLERPGDCFAALRHLLESNHEPRARQLRHIKHTIALYRDLCETGIVTKLDEPAADGKHVELSIDLPENFALTNPLSAFAVAAFELLDTDSDTYALDVISILECTLDDPRPILVAQRKQARDAAIAEMKADGIEYEERMERLEEITWPQPLAEEIGFAYETYRRGHPWLANTPPSPKSVLRYMRERSMTFAELVSDLGVARSEGVVLRYLTDCYRALNSGLPMSAVTDEIEDITDELGELIRGVDSSLIDEWEALTSQA